MSRNSSELEKGKEAVLQVFFCIALPIGYFVSDDGFLATAKGVFWAVVTAIGLWVLFLIAEALSNKSVAKQEAEAQRDKIKRKVSEHIDVLVRKRKQLRQVDDYGSIKDKEWKKEITRFFNSVIKELPGRELRITPEEIGSLIESLVKEVQESKREESSPYDDSMTGLEYEQWIAEQLQRLGWKTRVTQGAGDQGVDVVAENNGKVIAIQCKKYSSPVGNKAVQEAHAGRGYIEATTAAVVSNASFTRSACELAQSLGVQLLHHDQLSQLGKLYKCRISPIPDSPGSEAGAIAQYPSSPE